MGGVWKSLVKPVKIRLKEVIKYRIFTDENLGTILSEIQSVLNRNPLTSFTNKTSDSEPLTQNHLLTSEPSPNQSL